MDKKNRGPLCHIVKRPAIPWYQAWGIRLAALILALLFCAVVTMVLTGDNPISIYLTIYEGSFATPRRFWVLMQNLAILLCISLAMAPAFRMRFWNIGGEGQVMIGCLVCAAEMIYLGGDIPNAVLIILMIVSSLAAGAVWGMIPAFFKAKWNTNETLFTLMMNYVATQLVAFFIIIWESPKGSGKVGIINQKSMAGWLPTIADNKYLLNVLIVSVLTVVIFIYMKYSKHGYELAVVGESERTARYVGIKVGNVIVRTMALSGAICGLAGFLLVAGTDHRGYGGLDGQIQSARHDLHQLPPGFPGQGRGRDLDEFRTEPVLLGYPERNYHLFPDRLRVLYLIQACLQKGGEIRYV